MVKEAKKTTTEKGSQELLKSKGEEKLTDEELISHARRLTKLLEDAINKSELRQVIDARDAEFYGKWARDTYGDDISFQVGNVKYTISRGHTTERRTVFREIFEEGSKEATAWEKAIVHYPQTGGGGLVIRPLVVYDNRGFYTPEQTEENTPTALSRVEELFTSTERALLKKPLHSIA